MKLYFKVLLCSNAVRPCSLLYRGEGQVKYCRATLSVLSFQSFLSAAPSPSFILPRSNVVCYESNTIYIVTYTLIMYILTDQSNFGSTDSQD